MARIARLVVPGIPHHIVQRGNRRQDVFFNDDDRRAYLNYLKAYAMPSGIEFLSYCLMNNHVHIIGVPSNKDSFADGFGEAHRRYTRMINFRKGWRGYLWEGRFKSYPLGGAYLYAALRYIEMNPERAKMVKNAWDYPWSSAKAHVLNHSDILLTDNCIALEVEDWRSFLSEDDKQDHADLLETHLMSGRPLGDNKFIEKLERLTGKILYKQKPGPKERRHDT